MVTANELIEQTIRLQDQASGPLAKMAGAADNLYGGILKIVGAGAALGGALSLHEAWQSTEQYIKNLKEVRDLTGATATETDFLFSSARKAGVEYEQMKGVMFQLSRRGAMLEQTMAVTNGRVPGLAKKFKNLGVDMTKGPVLALENMAAAVKKGKLDTGELMSQFRIPQGAVNDFKEFLDKLDPKKLAKVRAGGVAGLVQEKDVDAFDLMEQASHRINDAWNRMKVLFLSRFMPILANAGQKFADNFEEMIPRVLSFAEMLSDHMDEIVLAAKTFVSVMTARKLLDLLGPGGAIGGALAAMGGAGRGGLMGGIRGGINAPVQMIGALLSQVGGIVAGFMAALPVLLAIAAAVATIHLGYKSITQSVDGTFERIKQTFDLIRARFDNLFAADGSIANLFQQIADLFGVEGGLSQFVGRLATISFEGLLWGVDGFLHIIRTAVGYLSEVLEVLEPDIHAGFDAITQFIGGLVKDAVEGFGIMKGAARDLYNWIAGSWFGKRLGLSAMDDGPAFKFDMGWLKGTGELWMKHWAKTEAEDKASAARLTANRWVAEAKAGMAGPEAPNKEPPKQNFDFRGSRFDITQNFAEGFDPDRIAVAFSDDLARLGEKRVQSSYQPAFSVGG